MTLGDTHVPLPILLEAQAQLIGDTVYVVLPDGQLLSYGEYHERVMQWASRLQDAGVTASETVLIMTSDPLVASAMWLALGWLGAIEVPVNVDLKGDYLAHVLVDSEAKLLVIDHQYIERFRTLPSSGSVERVLVLDGEPTPTVPVAREELPALTVANLDSFASLKSVTPPGPWDFAGIVYTSGTTGRSKGVLTTWGQRYETTVNTWPLDHLCADDTYYNTFPNFHIAGKGPFLQQALLGGRLVLKGRFRTSDFWADIDRFDVRVTQLVGAMASFLWKQPPSPDDRHHPLRKVLMTPIPSYVDAFKERFGVEVRSVFNMTEVSTPIVGNAFELPPTGSCGKARSGVELRLVDDNDLPVPTGEVGELVVRNERPWTLMQGYWRQPEATVESWRNLWFHTGDAFRMDDDGFYYFVDRKKDALRRRGENISSFEVESALLSTGLVRECAVVGVPSEHSEDEVMAFVIADDPEFSPEALHERAAQLLPKFMVPTYIEAVRELPRTPTARVRKHLLRERGVGPDTWSSQIRRSHND